VRPVEIPIVVLGAVLLVAPMDAAIRTFVLPRGVPVAFTRLSFRSIRLVFNQFVKFADDYEGRDRIMALYAPISLLALPTVFLISIFCGFACIFYVWDDVTWPNAFVESGSSLLTLGFARPPHLGMTFLSFAEAAIGLGLVALLIAYLPTIYNSFSRREVAVTGLAVRAGTPPTAWELLERAQRTGFLDRLDETWELWETWFQELSETHTSFGVLAFFRSPNPHRSWITAAGAVLDAASMRYAILDVPWSAPPALCIRSGYLALQEIATFYNIEFDPDPSPGDPISVTRDEFDTALQRLALAGCPVRADRDQAWRDYAGWRVNYDRVLTALAGLVMAPYAPWSSDRSTRYRGPRLHSLRARAERPAGPR
jgi:hypothetical protein